MAGRCMSAKKSLSANQSSILRRVRLISARRCLDFRILSFRAAGRGDFLRRAFSRAAISAPRCFCRAVSIASNKRSRASFRFRACDRESCTVTLNPLGRCRSVTAVETLFTFCPPGPPDRAKASSKSASRRPRCCIRLARESFTLVASPKRIADGQTLTDTSRSRSNGFQVRCV